MPVCAMDTSRDPPVGQAWCCVNLYAALCRLACFGGHAAEVVGLLEAPRAMIPELVAIGLAYVNKRAQEVCVECVCGSAPLPLP